MHILPSRRAFGEARFVVVAPRATREPGIRLLIRHKLDSTQAEAHAC